MRDDDLPQRQNADDDIAGQEVSNSESDGAEDGVHDDPDSAPPLRSLADDIHALIDDGKNYAEAELSFQKTRLSFAVGHGKSGAIAALGIFAFLHLALIGLVVGAILSLAPVVGPLLATAIVVGVLLLGLVIFALMAKRHFGKIGAAFESDSK